MIRLAVRCRPDQAEVVLAELVELAPGGVEEEAGPGWVEYAIYGGEGELPELGALEAAAGDDLVEIRSEQVPDDWADRWRDFHEPTVLGDGRVMIRPSWCESPQRPKSRTASRLDGPGREAAEPASLDIVIDPGQAFGTGAHPTTRMCVELLLELAGAGQAKGALVDLGTGSAVLAIVAAKLGWAPVVGVDHEVAALAAAAGNAAANGVSIETRRINLREETAPAAPTVVANLTAPLLRDVAASMEAPPDVLVCSGLLSREVDAVAAAFSEHGLSVRRRLDSGDWSALLLQP